jgi:O-6-methylguanine DNA methyltransferase
MKKASLVYDTLETALGRVYLVFAGKCLCSLSFRKPAKIVFKKGVLRKDFSDELLAYFEGKGDCFTQETVFLTGTEFERSVWNALMKIPYGQTRTYKWIAETIGNPGAVRAVGQALAKNPLPVIIPCHRVIESDGSIGGFSSGVEKKRRLLDLEYYALMSRRAEDGKP